MSERRTAMRRHFPVSNSQGSAGVGALFEMKCGNRGGAGRRVNKWSVRGRGGSGGGCGTCSAVTRQLHLNMLN